MIRNFLLVITTVILTSFNSKKEANINLHAVSGTVTFSATSNDVVKRNHYGKPTAFKVSESNQKQIVVWLEQTEDVIVQQTVIPTLNQKDIQFDPRLLVIRQGEKIKVTNSDPLYHNVFSLSSAKKIDVGKRLKNQSVQVVFEKSGLVQFFCDIHSSMNAEVLVLSKKTKVWEIANQNGMFSFDGIPNGEYKLHCYSSGFQENIKSIHVNSQAINVQIKLEK